MTKIDNFVVAHEKKINRIVEQIRNDKSGRPIVFVKKVVSHQVPKFTETNSKLVKIDVSDLTDIIEINEKDKTVIAEPGVTFSCLVKETLKRGLVPLVVPELKDITLGGAVAGCSVESMSYKVGGFHDTCLEYEVITSDGKVIKANRTENRDIFEMVHGAFGTLGFVSKIKFKLIEAKPFVEVKYKTFDSLEEYEKAIKFHYQKKDQDFIDGIIFSPSKFILCLGNFVEKAPYVHKYDWMGIYWHSVEKRKIDYLCTYDYFFRYDAGCHWVGRNYGLENPVVRLIFGKFFLSSTKMLKLAKKLIPFLKNKRSEIVIDIFTPISKWQDFWNFYLRKFNYFPVWMVPYQIKELYPWMNPGHFKGIKDKLFIDLAIYGMKERKDENHYRWLEEELLKLPGIKTLISHNSFTLEEFWQMWNKRSWLEVKKKTDKLNRFGDLYKKMSR